MSARDAQKDRGFDEKIYLLGADHHGYINRLKAIAACASKVDTFRVDQREIYWHGLTRQSESPFSKVPFEKRLGAPVTWRGVNTLRRFVEKYRG